MGGDWGPLNARARGLEAGLLGPSVLREAAAAGSTGDMSRRLRRAGYPPDGGELPGTADGLDRTVTRVAAWRLRLLGRWAGDLRRPLAVVFEAEDRRNLRTLLRGVTEGAGPETLLRGLVPTPTLPRRALAQLAEAGSYSGLAASLEEHGHFTAGPLGEAVADPTDASGLFRTELALDRAFAERVTSAARSHRELRDFTARRVDRLNAWTVLRGVAAGEERLPEELHLPGGQALSAERFGEVLSVADAGERRRLLGEALGGRDGRIVGDTAIPPALLTDRLLAADVGEARERARRQPLGPWPFLRFVLRFRAESRDLRRIGWGGAMGAPSTERVPVRKG